MTEQDLDLLGFDDVATSRPTIPASEYHLRVVNPVVKDKNDKTGKYIAYDAIVQAGDHTGYRIFNALFSLSGKEAWRFKAALKAVNFPIPAGLTLYEAAAFFTQNANGLEVIAKVGTKSGQSKNAEGKWEDDPEAGLQNTVGRWIGPA